MKKTLFFLGAALTLLAACNPEEKKDAYPTPAAGEKYVFEGTVSTDGFSWVTSSNLGIYALTDGVIAANLECKIDGWMTASDRDSSYFVPSQYEGKPTAKFQSPELDLVAGPNKFLVYSPYDPDLMFLKGQSMIYDLSVADAQTQSLPDVAGACFSYGVAEAIPGKDEVFPFTLNPVTALLKISISSTEFKDYGIKKVTMYDEAGAAQLGGNFDINIDNKSISAAKTSSKIATTITAPAAMGAKAQSIYMNVLPGDFSSTDLTFIVELTGEKGNVTLPLSHKGVKCEAGKTVELQLSDLKSSDNKYAWYCPVEPRQLSGLGYAYGDANTYLIQCKNGSTYTGATYSANADIPDEVVIDYRLRGNITAAEAPEDVTFEWAMMPNGTTPYVPRSMANASDYNASAVNPAPSNFTVTPNPANYTVTVKNTGAFAGAPILLMKKGGKILWGWSFWNIAADGTRLESVTVGGCKIANMTIGQATTDMTTWNANKAGTNPDPIFRTIHYYQWGRYLPIFWTIYWSLGWTYSAVGQEEATNTGNVLAINGPFTTLKESLEHPAGAICHIGSDSMEKWCTEDYSDLWGGVEGTSGQNKAGTKSIYDPCPKGWRVPDYTTIEAMANAIGEPSTATYNETKGQLGIMMGSEWLGYFGYIDFKAVTAANARPTNYGNTSSGAFSNGFSSYWSNYCASKTASSPFVIRFYGSNKKTEELANPSQAIRSNAAPVRCQVDESNR